MSQRRRRSEVGPGPRPSKETDHPLFANVLASEEGVCSLLGPDDALCTVYDSRPMVCRLYPFYVSAKAGGGLQVSVDHCPGVNAPGAGARRQRLHTARDIGGPRRRRGLPRLSAKEIHHLKGDDYCMVGPDEGPRRAGAGRTSEGLRASWAARSLVWEHLFGRMAALPPSLSPRDRLECLKADVVPWLEAQLRELHTDPTLVVDDAALGDSLGVLDRSLEARFGESARTQERHRVMLQEQGTVIQHGGGVVPSREETVFRTRVGETFSVDTRALLKLRRSTSNARRTEMAYLKEVVSREFVYGGVCVTPLTLRAEAALLFYLADAVELTSNALAIRSGRSRIGVGLVSAAICEVDARILGIVEGLGGEVASIAC